MDLKQREAGIGEGGGEGAISIIQLRSKRGLDQVGAEEVLRSKAPPACPLVAVASVAEHRL